MKHAVITGIGSIRSPRKWQGKPAEIAAIARFLMQKDAGYLILVNRG